MPMIDFPNPLDDFTSRIERITTLVIEDKRLEESLALFDELIEEAEQKQVYPSVSLRVLRDTLLPVEQQVPSAIIPYMQETLRHFEAEGNIARQITWLLKLADATSKYQHDHAQALQLLDRAEGLIASVFAPHQINCDEDYTAELHRVRAAIRGRMGDGMR